VSCHANNAPSPPAVNVKKHTESIAVGVPRRVVGFGAGVSISMVVVAAVFWAVLAGVRVEW